MTCTSRYQTSNLLVNYNKPGVSTEQGDKVMAQVDTDHISYSPIYAEGGNIGYWGTSTTRTTMYASTNTTNGAVSYLAIYIGFVLVIACAAILAIQQLSSVSDASRNYRVLSELGCDKSQIAHSVLAQQTVFFLFPLVIGIAHWRWRSRWSFDIVRIFGGLTISGMVGFTCAIFLAAYGGYFLVTYVMSRGIVNLHSYSLRGVARTASRTLPGTRGGRPHGRPFLRPSSGSRAAAGGGASAPGARQASSGNARICGRPGRANNAQPLVLEEVHLVSGEPKRHGEELALGRVGRDRDAHLLGEARDEPKAQARRLLVGAAVVAREAALEHARQVRRTHAASVIPHGQFNALVREALVQEARVKPDLRPALATGAHVAGRVLEEAPMRRATCRP